MSAVPFTHWEKRIVRRLQKSGGVILKSFEAEERLYFIEGVGRVGIVSVDSLIEKGVLVPVSDGMFGEAQTYRLTDDQGKLQEVA